MADKDFLSDRERSLEEEYFRRRDRELIEKMRQAAVSEQERADLSARTGLSDPQLLSELQALGFHPDTVVLLPLMPLLQVAWADREIEAGERALVVKLARARGVAEGSAADRQLSDWLDRKPAEHIFLHATRLIRAMLESANHPADLSAADLVKQAEAIAGASGGIFGILNRVSAEEKQILTELTQALKR